MNTSKKTIETKCHTLHCVFDHDVETGKLLGASFIMAKPGSCGNTNVNAFSGLFNVFIDEGYDLRKYAKGINWNGCMGAKEGLACPEAIQKVVLEYLHEKEKEVCAQ